MRAHGIRFTILIGVLVLHGLIGGPRVAGAQTEAPARLTIHNRICPVGFSGPDYYGVCHETPPDPGLPFTISGPQSAAGTTDVAGNITFEGLNPGDYAVSGGVPGEFADANYFCARSDALAQAYPFTETATGITVSLAAGDDIICDWYNTPIDLSGLPTPTPEPATLEVYAAICPPGYTGGSYFDDCFTNAASAGSVTFTLSDAAGTATDVPVASDGHARFGSVSAGTYSLSDSVPGDALDGRFVYCIFDGADAQTFALDYTENTISLTLGAGQRVACDWYILPADLRGEPQPTATPGPDGGVVVLPDTGGTNGSASTTISVWLVMLLAGGGVAGFLAIARSRMHIVRSAVKIRADKQDIWVERER